MKKFTFEGRLNIKDKTLTFNINKDLLIKHPEKLFLQKWNIDSYDERTGIYQTHLYLANECGKSNGVICYAGGQYYHARVFEKNGSINIDYYLGCSPE